MGKKSFTLFTTDVVGSMKEGPCVVPATEGSDRVEAQKRKEAQQARLFVKLGTILSLLERQEKARLASLLPRVQEKYQGRKP